MAKKQQEKGINPALEQAMADMLAQVMKDPTASLIDRMRVIDRAIKLEALKLREIEDSWGSGFLTSDDDK